VSRNGPSASLTRADHEFVDHTSEVILRLRAPSYPELIGEATSAFAELVPPHKIGRPSDEWREFRFDGPTDRVGRLVDWLNELVYLCDVDQWLPVEVEVDDVAGAELHIRARGVDLDEPFVLVKAATLQNAFVHERAGGVEGEVTLDV